MHHVRHDHLQCNNPVYSGNGTVCARDSDEDTLPDVDLGCDEIFCEKVCTYVCTIIYMFATCNIFYRMHVH